MNIKRFKNEGFTLIELLVSIAIIGVLSTIVLHSLNNSRTKAYNSKVIQQLRSLRSIAEIYYANQTPNSYGSNVLGSEVASGGRFGNGCSTNMFADTNTVGKYTLVIAYPSNVTMKCTSTGSAYVVTASMNGGSTFWCVDSAGNSRLTNTNAVQANSATVCP